MRLSEIFVIVMLGFTTGCSSTKSECQDRNKEYRPAINWKDGCSQVPQFKSDSFSESRLKDACSIVPDLYNAPIRPPEQQFLPGDQEPISQLFAVSAPNSVGTTQLKNGVSLLFFGDSELCETTVISNSYKDTPRGKRSFTINRGFQHPVKNQSMLFVKEGINFFDPETKSLTAVAGGTWAYPIDPEAKYIFSADKFVDVETDLYGRVISERKTDTLLLRIVETQTNKDTHQHFLPYTLAFTSAGNLFYHCLKNQIQVFNAQLQEQSHPISKAVQTIPGIDTLSIFSIEVHPVFPIAFLEMGYENPETYKGTRWLWMLIWTDANHPSAIPLTEGATPVGFSPDYQWLHFSCNVPLSNNLHKERGHFVIQIQKKSFERGSVDPELVISGPIRLWMPADLQSPSENRLSGFTWVTKPSGLAVILNDKVLRWTFPE